MSRQGPLAPFSAVEAFVAASLRLATSGATAALAAPGPLSAIVEAVVAAPHENRGEAVGSLAGCDTGSTCTGSVSLQATSRIRPPG